VTISSSSGRPSSAASNRSGGTFDVATLDRRVAELDDQLADGAIWNDPDRAADLNRQRSVVAVQRDRDRKLETLVADAETLLELDREGEAVDAEFEDTLARLEPALTEVEVGTMLSGEEDHNNAFLEIHPGAGGVDAQDWAEMLLRMYVYWAEKGGYQAELLDRLEGDGAGIKSATLRIVGPDAYGWLKAERGVHRLVRISPFDAQARRHTAFASVDVIPEVDDTIKIDIQDKDLKVDTYRSSGAGGQHVNVTDSAVRITHLPTGLVVTCQDERSQPRNREKAMRVLRARLHEREREKQEAERVAKAGDKKEIGFGSQIRSYVLAPYRMVKDHRTDFEMGDVDRVLGGDLTGFMKAWLLAKAKS